jgi:hypothetical protein
MISLEDPRLAGKPMEDINVGALNEIMLFTYAPSLFLNFLDP